MCDKNVLNRILANRKGVIWSIGNVLIETEITHTIGMNKLYITQYNEDGSNKRQEAFLYGNEVAQAYTRNIGEDFKVYILEGPENNYLSPDLSIVGFYRDINGDWKEAYDIRRFIYKETEILVATCSDMKENIVRVWLDGNETEIEVLEEATYLGAGREINKGKYKLVSSGEGWEEEDCVIRVRVR
jgi:hypothetical protein